MKFLVIICEGPTEKAFCEELLYPYLLSIDISAQFVLPQKSGGGIINWEPLKTQIKRHLGSGTYVTTFLDYYGLKTTFPNFKQAQQAKDKVQTVVLIEQGMSNQVNNSRFIPYIQLHEFEALLFCDIEPFKDRFEAGQSDFDALECVIHKYPNPENINDGAKTAPSKRLIEYLDKYDKVLDGKALASRLGLAKIRSKCPHFNDWIERLKID